MRIAIDISQIIYGTGVSVYTENLVKSLLKIDKENQYVLFGGSLRRFKELKQKMWQFRSLVYGTKKIETRVYPYPPSLADFVWNRLHILPIEKLVGVVDVFHSSDWAQPPARAFKVTTVHDLAPLKFPKSVHPEIVAVHRKRLRRVKKEVDRVIVPSTQTKKDLVDYGIAESKIRVIYEASVSSPANLKAVEEVKRKYKIGEARYLLAVGITATKNTERIIKAFDLAGGGEKLKLVLAGRPVNIQIKERRGIRLVGAVSDAELSALYTGAEALVYPSLYEGFGIPILDAFICSCPVVTSNLSSMPEVAKDAAVLVDPYSVDSIADGIKKAISCRKGLIEKGLRRVKDFSWEKCARETLDVYNEIRK